MTVGHLLIFGRVSLLVLVRLFHQSPVSHDVSRVSPHIRSRPPTTYYFHAEQNGENHHHHYSRQNCAFVSFEAVVDRVCE